MPDTLQDKKATLLRALLAELIPMAQDIEGMRIASTNCLGIQVTIESRNFKQAMINIHEEDIIRARESALIARAHQEMARARALLGA